MIILQIVAAIGLLGVAGAIGYCVATLKACEDLNDIRMGLERCIEGHDKLVESSDAAINSCVSYVENTYRELVRLRDSGTEDLDELIGNLGAFLEGVKE